MRDGRPDPDALLQQLRQDDSTSTRGRLKVFLGASAGVGKTYAMLSEAHEQTVRGVDVVAGYVEAHGRIETESLLHGLEALPRRSYDYRGVTLSEFDLDAALKRRPELLLVDELAHSNAPGSRHTKRWQDVEELLDAGISVTTTVNIQHLESLNDAVAKVTGVLVRETVPDAFLDRADEIEVIDLPPEALRQRLREGKVYVPERIDHALEGFFQTKNLLALRELALRRTADRVEAEAQRLRNGQGLWPTKTRVLVCVAPTRMATRVVRAAHRLATEAHAEIIAVSVDSDRQARRSGSEKQAAQDALSLAERLGMETVTLGGHDIAGEVLTFARRRSVTLIVVGKPIRARWRELLFGSVVDELVRRSGEIDLYVITGEADVATAESSSTADVPKSGWPEWIATAGTVGVSLGLAAAIDKVGGASANIILVLLLAVAWVASKFGRRESVVASLASVLAFNFLFVEPRYTFVVSDTQYILTLGIMLAVALLISSMTLTLRAQAASSSERERRSAALYALSRELARSRGRAEISEAAARNIRSVFDLDLAILLPEEGELRPVVGSEDGFERIPSETGVARWSFEHGEVAGQGTDTLPMAAGFYMPLVGGQAPVGVLALLPKSPHWPLSSAQKNLLETFGNSLGLALERSDLARESQKARIQAESERLRNALLSSISHDLRTPLTSIAGAASALVEQGGGELAQTIYHESLRMNLQVQNLLDMTRLQSGELPLRMQWSSLEEVIGSALDRCRTLLGERRVTVRIPTDFPLLQVDPDLIEKLLVNLFENAAKYIPERAHLEISAVVQSEVVRIVVADDGPGIPAGQEAAVFERFAQGGKKGEGLGLGLAICRAIMRLHNGRIWVRNRREGGAEFHLELPRPTTQPEVPIG